MRGDNKVTDTTKTLRSAFENGAQDLQVTYHPNGQIHEIGIKNTQGHWEGPFECYHENGQLEGRGSMNNRGCFVGPFESYYENGQLKEKGLFAEIEKPKYEQDRFQFIGPFERYYENGQLQQKGTKNAQGELEGLAECYYENGQLEERVTFGTQRKILGYEHYKRDGSLVTRSAPGQKTPAAKPTGP